MKLLNFLNILESKPNLKQEVKGKSDDELCDIIKNCFSDIFCQFMCLSELERRLHEIKFHDRVLEGINIEDYQTDINNGWKSLKDAIYETYINPRPNI